MGTLHHLRKKATAPTLDADERAAFLACLARVKSWFDPEQRVLALDFSAELDAVTVERRPYWLRRRSAIVAVHYEINDNADDQFSVYELDENREFRHVVTFGGSLIPDTVIAGDASAIDFDRVNDAKDRFAESWKNTVASMGARS